MIALHFWMRFARPKHGCWIWPDNRAISYRGKTVSPQRLSYLLTIGPVPPGHVLFNSCESKCCVRPEHIRLGSRVEAAKSMAARAKRFRRTRRGPSLPGNRELNSAY